MHKCTHKKRKSASHPAHVVTFCALACRGPLSLFSRPLWPQPPRFTSLSCDRPAMWDSRYCPSLLLTHFPPLHPCSSTLLLVPFSWPPPSSTPPPHTENDQPSLVWFDRGKFYLTFEGKFSLHQASVRTNPLSFEAHLCKLLPLISSLPSPLFLPRNPSITWTHATLTPGWGPSHSINMLSRRLLPSHLDIVHSHFVCVDCLSFIPWRIVGLLVLISLSSSLSSWSFGLIFGLSDLLWSCQNNSASKACLE